ncbi:hybrid-cluster NAD(P)-dependent oxidoreductase [Gordonia aichiensis]|uniref:Putative oxidoreductase n=1 Tax=Gordonia aichiensis NBRC 108223 TaxID=1220583 RepID=L7KL83_9ACTN|nr:hybrid-cluster NAD(P)-dependent oxidoreductase [Gordonia aichiensis]GAC49256.1 putative oxidoreductase [Gordonia aichiensis NBRC 108223]
MSTDHLLVCVDRTELTRDMATFTFRTVEPYTFVFNPGQFLSIGVEIDGRTVERCYSISSSPTRPDTLSISVKRKLGGHVSNWLHDNMSPGRTLTASGPLGRFSYIDKPATKLLLISAGSGITPVMSMLRAATDSDAAVRGHGGSVSDIVFIHSARTLDDIPFRTELDDLAVQHPGVTVAFACTRLVDDDSSAAWSGHRGRLDAATLTRICPDLAEREVFLCGPGQFRAGVRSALVASGGSLANIHEESFGFRLPTVDDAAPGEMPEGVSVDFTRRARRVHVTAGTTILAAAAAAGVTLPSSCGVGLCGSCKVTKTSGDVVMNHQGGIHRREIEQGKILLCCSEPLSPVVIDL